VVVRALLTPADQAPKLRQGDGKRKTAD
jgi:hypothetical protein